MTYLGEGDLAGARAVLKAAPKEVEPTALVAYLATTEDLVWVLDEEQRELLLRLTPSAFDDDRGAWALCLAQAYALKGDAANVRTYAEEARKAFEEQLRAAPDDARRHVCLGLALAYLGRKEEAIREGERGVALDPVSKDAAATVPTIQHQLARIYILVGEPEKALDQLEPLLEDPLLPLARLAQDRPQLRPAAQEPEVPEARRRRRVPQSGAKPANPHPRRFQLGTGGATPRSACPLEVAHRMTLAAGTRLGSYEILAPSGRAGWARCTGRGTRSSTATSRSRCCRRRVAADPDALARFEREAKAVAALSHPNILAIHDFGTHDGTAYAVTELLEGETLRGKLDAGSDRAEAGVDYALQIAKGLSAAHEKGVVHRDLKPENVFVSKDGHVKILDFGLAKKVEATRATEQTSAADGLGPHRARDGDGDDGLHVARAGAGPAGRSPLGHLLVRGDPVRAAVGQEGVQAGHGERHDRGDPARRSRRS